VVAMKYLLLGLLFILHLNYLSFAQSSFGNTIDFDGAGDYASTVNEPVFPTGNGTIEIWLKIRSITEASNFQIGDMFFAKNEEQWNEGDFYMFFESASGKLKARIQSPPSQPPIETDVQSNSSFWNHNEIWFHMAFTWGNQGMRLYVNTELQSNQSSVIHSALNNAYNFYVGAHGYMLHNGSYIVAEFFDGQIDEVRIWNYQRTSEQLFALWDAPLDSGYYSSIDSGLVGYWTFDELEDLGINNDGVDDVRDFSILHNHLDLSGDAHLVPSNVVIPVELTSFTALTSKGKVTLSWATATETNNHMFEIERSIEDGQFVTIGYVEGHGTTTEIQNYQFIDEISDIQATSLSYRLKQIDYDGSYEYSEVVEVTNIAPTDFVIQQNYPNPFNPVTTISYSLPIKAQVELFIYNTLGESIKRLVNEEKEAGRYSVEFNATALPSGIYFYRLQAGSFVETKKMVLMK